MRLSLNRYKVDKLGENDTGLRKVLPSQLFKSPRVQATNSAPAVRADVIQWMRCYGMAARRRMRDQVTGTSWLQLNKSHTNISAQADRIVPPRL